MTRSANDPQPWRSQNYIRVEVPPDVLQRCVQWAEAVFEVWLNSPDRKKADRKHLDRPAMIARNSRSKGAEAAMAIYIGQGLEECFVVHPDRGDGHIDINATCRDGNVRSIDVKSTDHGRDLLWPHTQLLDDMADYLVFATPAPGVWGPYDVGGWMTGMEFKRVARRPHYDRKAYAVERGLLHDIDELRWLLEKPDQEMEL